jgi:kinetochore protein Spc7/SPC105
MITAIEQDTLEEPPLLFREYVLAPPELKRIMDSQFKLVKTWARSSARGVWYNWRTELLGGVMLTLQKNMDGLKKVRFFLWLLCCELRETEW